MFYCASESYVKNFSSKCFLDIHINLKSFAKQKCGCRSLAINSFCSSLQIKWKRETYMPKLCLNFRGKNEVGKTQKEGREGEKEGIKKKSMSLGKSPIFAEVCFDLNVLIELSQNVLSPNSLAIL